MIKGRNTYTFNAAEVSRLLGISNPGTVSVVIRSVQTGRILVMMHGQRPRHFSTAEFTRLLGIQDSRPVVNVRWHVQDARLAVWMKPA